MSHYIHTHARTHAHNKRGFSALLYDDLAHARELSQKHAAATAAAAATGKTALDLQGLVRKCHSDETDSY